MKSRIMMSAAVLAATVAAANAPFSRYRFNAGGDAPILYYDAYSQIESGSKSEIAFVLIHGWGSRVGKVLPVLMDALSAISAKKPFSSEKISRAKHNMASVAETVSSRANSGAFFFRMSPITEATIPIMELLTRNSIG